MYCGETIVDDEGSTLSLDGGWDHDDELTLYCGSEVNLRPPQVRELIAYLQAWCETRTFHAEVPDASR